MNGFAAQRAVPVTAWSPRHTAWTPAPAAAPAARQLGRTSMGQLSPSGGDVILGLVGVALAGATAYVGISYGQSQKGLKSAMGWVVGVGGGLATLARSGQFLGLLGGIPVTGQNL